MRLLVYGGNQYAERRRIGAWPADISTDVLQDTYGCSERTFSFGIGLLEASPFIIFRRIQAYNQRSYPLTVLLDPGESVWTEFDWNGAYLLWALFGEPEAPGNNILREPETFHSEQHLRKLFESVRRRELIEVVEEEADPNSRFAKLWSGAVLSPGPVLVSADAYVATGTRPSIKEVYLLLQDVPVSLRCGIGWLVAGNLNHVKPFGIKLIFDDVKNEASEVNKVSELEEQGSRLISAIKSVSKDPAGEDSKAMVELLRRPIFMSEKAVGVPAEKVLDSLSLLGELIELSDGPVIHGSDESEKRYGRVIDAVRAQAPFADHIASITHALLKSYPNSLSIEETNFALIYAERHKLSNSIKERLNEDAALDYFVDNRIYPSQAGGLMPATLRMAVCERLLSTETTTIVLPKIIDREQASLVAEPENLRKLVEIAVRKSADSELGLRPWESYLDSSQLGSIIADCLRARAIANLNELTSTAVTDYLLFGNDPGGASLQSLSREAIGELLGFVMDIYENSNLGDLQERSGEWLTALVKSELRRRANLSDKEKIAVFFVDDWTAFRQLADCFAVDENVGCHPSKFRIDEEERSFLVAEFHDFIDRTVERKSFIVPDLINLQRILGPDHLSTIVEGLYAFEPDLNLNSAPDWIYDWNAIASDAGKIAPQVSTTAKNKFQAEVIRFYLTTNCQLPDVAPLENFDEANLGRLIGELLYGGGPEDDENRRQRFSELLERDKKATKLQNHIRSAYLDMESDPNKQQSWLRRFVADRTAMRLFDAALNERDRKRLDQSKRDWATQQSDEVSKTLHSWLTEAAHSTSLTAMLKKEQSRWNHTNEKIFASAMKMTLREIIESEDQGEAFVSLHLHNEQLLLFLKPYLTSKQAKQLAKLVEAEKRRLEIVAIETYIFGGTPENDDEFRRKIDDILSHAQSEASPVIEAAIQKALSKSEYQENLFRRFAKSSNKVAQPAIEELKVTNLIFDSLLLETQMDFFRALMKFHDLPLKDHPVCDFACTTTKKLLPKNGKRPGFKPTTLQRAILCFMTLHDERSRYVKKQVAQWLLGGSEMFHIDKYLRDYEYKRLRPGGTAQPKAVTEQPGTAKSLLAKAGRFFWGDADD